MCLPASTSPQSPARPSPGEWVAGSGCRHAGCAAACKQLWRRQPRLLGASRQHLLIPESSPAGCLSPVQPLPLAALGVRAHAGGAAGRRGGPGGARRRAAGRAAAGADAQPGGWPGRRHEEDAGQGGWVGGWVGGAPAGAAGAMSVLLPGRAGLHLPPAWHAGDERLDARGCDAAGRRCSCAWALCGLTTGHRAAAGRAGLLGRAGRQPSCCRRVPLLVQAMPWVSHG